MKFLANENFPLPSVKLLINYGYDITSVAIDYKSIADKDVIEIANKSARIILTFDRDYGELIYRYGLKSSSGVIYFRLSEYTPEYPGVLLHKLIIENDFTFLHSFTVISENGIRQRSY